MGRSFRKEYGPVFGGYQGWVNDRTMDRSESPDLRGVLCHTGGILRSFGTLKSTSVTDHVPYSALFASGTSDYVEVKPSSGTFPVLGARWTIMGAFSPTAVDAVQYIFDRVVTISASPYHAPGLRANADNTLTLLWTNSAGVDKSITSVSTISISTTYFFIARRVDDAMVLYVATPSTVFTQWATGTGLGDEDAPADAGTHYFVIGANGTNSAPDSQHFAGNIDGITVLELALEDDEMDMGYLEWPQPRLDRCLVHLPLDEAAGAQFVDYSSRGHTTVHAAGVTHQSTALLAAPTPVNFIGELLAPDGRQYVDLIVDGSLYASRTNA